MARVLASEPRDDTKQPIAGSPEPRTLSNAAASLAATGRLVVVGGALAIVRDGLSPVGRAFAGVRETVALIGDDVATLRSVGALLTGRHQTCPTTHTVSAANRPPSAPPPEASARV